MIEYKQGNILDVQEGVIAHGCNMVGGFGAGLAGAIAMKYPHVRDFYLRTYKKATEGYYHLVPVSRTLLIANCYTQKTVATYHGEIVANEEWIFRSLFAVCNISKLLDLPVHTVPIGAGLGGLQWEQVKKALVAAAGATQTRITVWDFQPRS